MERLGLKVNDRVIHKLNAAALWYIENRDKSYVRTLLSNYQKAIELLRIVPTAGRLSERKSKKAYRMYAAHKKCIIVYWFNSKTLYVSDLIFTNTFKDRF